MKLEIVTEMPCVVLRPLQVQDADELFLLVNHNREHLRAWLPWLDQAKTRDDQVKFIQRGSECAAKGTETPFSSVAISREWFRSTASTSGIGVPRSAIGSQSR